MSLEWLKEDDVYINYYRVLYQKADGVWTYVLNSEVIPGGNDRVHIFAEASQAQDFAAHYDPPAGTSVIEIREEKSISQIPKTAP